VIIFVFNFTYFSNPVSIPNPFLSILLVFHQLTAIEMTFEKQCIIMTTGLRLKKKTTEFGVGEFKTLYS